MDEQAVVGVDAPVIVTTAPLPDEDQDDRILNRRDDPSVSCHNSAASFAATELLAQSIGSIGDKIVTIESSVCIDISRLSLLLLIYDLNGHNEISNRIIKLVSNLP